MRTESVEARQGVTPCPETAKAGRVATPGLL